MALFTEEAARLQSALNLKLAPVAVCFTDDLPDNIPAYAGKHVAAGCKFWEQAAAGTFATTAEDHKLCSIGIYTHNLAGAPATQQHELETTLTAMMGLDYIREQEVQQLPVRESVASYAIYGPLAEITLEPEVVLLFADSHQSLVITEAVARVDSGIPVAMGRPACAVIPGAGNQDRATMSLGCCGARAYIDALTDNVALWALPGSKLSEYAEQIATLAKGNKVLTNFHEMRKADIESGVEPTVEESLQKL